MSNVKVEYHKVDYKDFGFKNSEVYNHIYNMAKEYRFWFSGFCNTINDTNMTEYVTKKAQKHNHKFVLYNFKDTDTFYLVQYCKTYIKIYYCYDGKHSTIMKNIKAAYKKAIEERICQEDYSSEDMKLIL